MTIPLIEIRVVLEPHAQECPEECDGLVVIAAGTGGVDRCVVLVDQDDDRRPVVRGQGPGQPTKGVPMLCRLALHAQGALEGAPVDGTETGIVSRARCS